MLQKFSFSVIAVVLAFGALSATQPAATATSGQVFTDQALLSAPAATVYAVPAASEVFGTNAPASNAAPTNDLSFG
jgi:hypothetical protein